MLAVGEVGDVGDAGDLLGVDAVFDLLDDLLGADEVGQLGHDEAGAAGGELLDRHLGPGLERSAPGRVGVLDAVEADDRAAGRKIGTGHVGHQVVERRIRILEQVPGGGGHLDEVVRRHVGGHADRDAGRAVDEQVRVGRRQHRRAASAGCRSSGRSRRRLRRASRSSPGRRPAAEPRCSGRRPGRRRASRSCRDRR